MIYSVSFLNRKWGNPATFEENLSLSAIIVDCPSKNEAIGEAVQWNEKNYNPDNGWSVAKIICLEV